MSGGLVHGMFLVVEDGIDVPVPLLLGMDFAGDLNLPSQVFSSYTLKLAAPRSRPTSSLPPLNGAMMLR